GFSRDWSSDVCSSDLIRTRTDGQKFNQPVPRAVDAALHRADGAITDARRLLVGHAGRADQNQRFALVCGQLLQGLAEIEEIHVADRKSVVEGKKADQA